MGESIENIESSSEHSSSSNDLYTNTNIQVVVGLDFGTISSGFSCASNEENMCYHDSWPDYVSYSGLNQKMKISTAYRYEDNTKWVRLTNINNGRNRVLDLFKLYLGDSPDNLKPKLPYNYKMAITNYLRKFGMVSLNVKSFY